MVHQSRQNSSDGAVSETSGGYEWICMPHGPDATDSRSQEGKSKRDASFNIL